MTNGWNYFFCHQNSQFSFLHIKDQILQLWNEYIHFLLSFDADISVSLSQTGAAIPETWSRSPVEWTAHQLRRCPDEAGSDGRTAYSWAYSSCKMWKATANQYNPKPQTQDSSCIHSFCPFPFLAVHFQELLTSTAWGGSWSHQGSSQVQVAAGCCFPHPRWWQMSPHLCRGFLR